MKIFLIIFMVILNLFYSSRGSVELLPFFFLVHSVIEKPFVYKIYEAC
jgi:hypothetical protein